MKDLKEYHRYIDEAGDTTFYLSGKKSAIGVEGVSKAFILGMVKISEPLNGVRQKIFELQKYIENNLLFDVPSVRKKKEKTGYYLHATDDLPEIRMLFFNLIKTIDCSLEAVVARKNIERFETKHKGNSEYFYADMLSHLLKNKFSKHEKMVLNISERGLSTKHRNLNLALQKAEQRFVHQNEGFEIKTKILFDVQRPTKEPLLNLADYFCWTIQRVFEKGELRFYNYLQEKIPLVIDLYDTDNYTDFKNYYDNKTNPLTEKNKISPLLH